MFTDRRVVIGASLAGLVFLAAAAAVAQEAPPASAPAPTTETASKPSVEVPAEIGDKALEDLWRDFLGYVRIGRADIALSYGQAILNKNPKPEDIYGLSLKYKDSLARMDQASRLSDSLKKIVGSLRDLMEKGYQGDRANPDQIKKAIEGLGGSLRQYEMSVDYLKLSGEFAVPQLVQKLGAKDTTAEFKQRIVNVLLATGKDDVNGLTAALMTKDQELLALVAGTLAKIGYQQPAPYMKLALERKDLVDRTRAILESSLAALAGKDAVGKSVAELAYTWAENYYRRNESLVPDPRSSTANVATWEEGLGVVYKPVPTEIFCDVMAMRLAKLALEHDPRYSAAEALWLAADFKRESELPAGAKDTTAPADMPPAKFFALATAPGILQDVLNRGLKEKNINVILGAMEALVKTQGAKSLVQPVANGAQPLVEAMFYPDQRVRFMAALSLAEALPDKAFSGSDAVVSVLNEALRQTARKTALLVVAEENVRNVLKDALRGAGYEVNDQPDAVKAIAAVRAAGGVNVVVVGGKSAGEIVPALRRDVTLATMPVVVVTDDAAVAGQFKNDPLAVVVGTGGNVADAAAKAAAAGAGPALAPEQAVAWAVRAANAARLLSITSNTVYDLKRIQPALIEALNNTSPEVQLAAAEALAVMSSAEAQRAVAGLTLKADLPEKNRIELLRVLTESVRRFGNQLTDPQIKGIYDLVVGTGAEPLRVAAAQAYGSLNLPGEKGKSLILQPGGKE
ncbi:MAG: hypothetical protein ACE15C_00175 [Phycisphaerae bacterium]